MASLTDNPKDQLNGSHYIGSVVKNLFTTKSLPTGLYGISKIL